MIRFLLSGLFLISCQAGSTELSVPTSLPLECHAIPAIDDQLCFIKTTSPLGPYDDVVFYRVNAQAELSLLGSQSSGVATFSFPGFSEQGRYMWLEWAEEGHAYFIFYKIEQFLDAGTSANVIATLNDYAFDAFVSFSDEDGVIYSQQADMGDECISEPCLMYLDLNTSTTRAANFMQVQKIAHQGNALAQYKLASMYNFGDGVEENINKAFQWMKKSAEQNDMKSQYVVSMMYTQGLGTEENHKNAFSWMKKSADQGYADAQHQLAKMYDMGIGVKQDFHQAVKWFEKSAAHGHARAQTDLALMYLYGRGVAKNEQLAKKWFAEACDNGDDFFCDKINHPFNPKDPIN